MATSPAPHRSFGTNRMGLTPRLATGRAVELAGNGLLAISAVVASAALLLLVIGWLRQDDLPFAVDLFLMAGRGLVLAALLMAVGRFVRREARMLADFTLVLDTDRVSWSGAVAGTAAWNDLRHVVVTARPHRRRRLIFVGSSAGQPDTVEGLVRASPAAHAARRLVSPSRYILDVPLDQLDQPPEAVLRAVRSASGGRFPDLYPAEQFPTSLEDQ